MSINLNLSNTSNSILANWREQTSPLITTMTGDNDHFAVINKAGFITSWGNSFPSPPVNPIKTISFGYNYWIAIQRDGVAVGGGDNHGQINFPTELTHPVALKAGHSHSLALDINGNIYECGSYYIAGNVPTFPADPTNFKYIDAHFGMSAAIKNDGTLYIWGDATNNVYGQYNIPPEITNVTQVALGEHFVVVLKPDGTIASWGQNQTDIERVTELTDVISIAAGKNHAMALRANGDVVAWGDGYVGAPPVVVSSSQNIIAIVCTDYNSMALSKSGQFYIWGSSYYHALEISNSLEVALPTDVATYKIYNNNNLLHTSPVEESTYEITGLLANTAYNITIEGYDNTETLLNTTTSTTYTYLSTPNNLSLTNGSSDNSLILTWDEVIGATSYNIYQNGILFTTSNNTKEFLNLNTKEMTYQFLVEAVNTNTKSLPAQISSILLHSLTSNDTSAQVSWHEQFQKTAIFIGPYNVSTVLLSNKTVLSWGNNQYEQCDVPAGLNNVIGLATTSSEFSPPGAIKADGTVAIWGQDIFNVLQPPIGLNNVKELSAGYSHILALKHDGSIVTWGRDLYNLLTIPVRLTYPGACVGICCGDMVSMVIKSDRTVFAWGNNQYGQCDVPAGLNNVIQLTASDKNAYALKADGTVVGWGYQWNNETWNDTRLVPNDLNNVVAISSNPYYTLALKANGTVVGWGDYNDTYQLRANLNNLKDIAAIEAGTNGNSFALKTDGTMIVWGDNQYGQSTIPNNTSPFMPSNTTKFDLYKNGDFLQSFNTPIHSYLVTGLTDSSNDSFSIKGYDINGNKTSSSISEQVWRLLERPVNLVASNKSNTSFTLSWSQISGATSYNIYQNGVLQKSSLTNTTNISVNNGYEYEYTIEAINANNYSELSDIFLYSTYLPAPSDLIATNQTSTTINISWAGVSNATSYQIYINEELYATVTDLFKNNILLSNNTDYNIKILAINQTSVSAPSNILTITKSLSTNLDFSNNKATITWTNTTGYSEYRVRYKTNFNDAEYTGIGLYLDAAQTQPANSPIIGNTGLNLYGFVHELPYWFVLEGFKDNNWDILHTYENNITSSGSINLFDFIVPVKLNLQINKDTNSILLSWET